MYDALYWSWGAWMCCNRSSTATILTVPDKSHNRWHKSPDRFFFSITVYGFNLQYDDSIWGSLYVPKTHFKFQTSPFQFGDNMTWLHCCTPLAHFRFRFLSQALYKASEADYKLPQFRFLSSCDVLKDVTMTSLHSMGLLTDHEHHFADILDRFLASNSSVCFGRTVFDVSLTQCKHYSTEYSTVYLLYSIAYEPSGMRTGLQSGRTSGCHCTVFFLVLQRLWTLPGVKPEHKHWFTEKAAAAISFGKRADAASRMIFNAKGRCGRQFHVLQPKAHFGNIVSCSTVKKVFLQIASLNTIRKPTDLQ